MQDFLAMLEATFGPYLSFIGAPVVLLIGLLIAYIVSRVVEVGQRSRHIARPKAEEPPDDPVVRPVGRLLLARKRAGKKITMIIPDYVFGYEHRDVFSVAAKAAGGEVNSVIAISPMESSFTKYFSQIPADTDAIYHVMVGPGVLTFVRELGESFNNKGPQLFGFIDSLEAVDLASPGLEFLEGSHLWEAFPRFAAGLPTDFAGL